MNIPDGSNTELFETKYIVTYAIPDEAIAIRVCGMVFDTKEDAGRNSDEIGGVPGAPVMIWEAKLINIL